MTLRIWIFISWIIAIDVDVQHIINQVQNNRLQKSLNQEMKVDLLNAGEVELCQVKRIPFSDRELNEIRIENQPFAYKRNSFKHLVRAKNCKDGSDAHLFIEPNGVSGTFYHLGEYYVLEKLNSKISEAKVVDLTSPEFFDVQEEHEHEPFLSSKYSDTYTGELWCDVSESETCDKSLMEGYDPENDSIAEGCKPCISLEPGEQKIYIQVEIDSGMIKDFAKKLKKKKKNPPKDISSSGQNPLQIPGFEEAVDYVVNLYSTVSHDVYHKLGIDLVLCAIHVHRSQFSHELEKTTYIAAMREIEIPKTCHLVHGLTTLWINGGRASTNGLYVNDGYAVIGDIRGHLEKYDRKLIAHETGHNLGLHHAKDCTLMTQTHSCDGGLKNIKMHIGQRQVLTMVGKIKKYQTTLQKKVDAFLAQSNGVESVTSASFVGPAAEEEELEQEEEEIEEIDRFNLQQPHSPKKQRTDSSDYRPTIIILSTIVGVLAGFSLARCVVHFQEKQSRPLEIPLAQATSV